MKQTRAEKWIYPEHFEPRLRRSKPKTRSGETRKMKNLLKKAREQGFIIKADFSKFEEDVSAKHYIYDVNLDKRLTPKFRTAKECMDILPDFMRNE